MITIEEDNALGRIMGVFAGLGDTEWPEEWPMIDHEDPIQAADLIRASVLPLFLSCKPSERVKGLAVLRRLVAYPAEYQERFWESDLPPFPFPKKYNIYERILSILETDAHAKPAGGR